MQPSGPKRVFRRRVNDPNVQPRSAAAIDRAAASGTRHMRSVQSKLLFVKGSSMLSGKVRFYDRERRFRNIAPDDGTEDIFVHETALERAGVYDLTEGQQVRYEAIRDALTGRLMVRVLHVPLPAGGEAPWRSRPGTDLLPGSKAEARTAMEAEHQKTKRPRFHR